MTNISWDWFFEKEDKKNRKEWEPIPLELPIDEEIDLITPPTTSSKDETIDAFENITTIKYEL